MNDLDASRHDFDPTKTNKEGQALYKQWQAIKASMQLLGASMVSLNEYEHTIEGHLEQGGSRIAEAKKIIESIAETLQMRAEEQMAQFAKIDEQDTSVSDEQSTTAEHAPSTAPAVSDADRQALYQLFFKRFSQDDPAFQLLTQKISMPMPSK